MTTYEIIERLSWIKRNVNSGVYVNVETLMSRFNIGKTTAKNDFKYFTDRRLLKYSRRLNAYIPLSSKKVEICQ